MLKFGCTCWRALFLVLGLVARTSLGATAWTEGFEEGAGGWTTSGNVECWEIGEPTYESGPLPHSGKRVAGTILSGPYISGNDSLISPEFLVPLAVERPRLRYWDWHDTADGNHYGEVFIRPAGGSWRSLGQIAKGNHGRKWSQHIIDLREYGGQKVQISFYFTRHVSVPGAAAGWYVDDVSLETGAMTFNNPEGFENGFGDWSIDNAMWEIGAPTYGNGPQPRSGKGVAGTILSGPYIAGDATLKSPEFLVPLAVERPRLRYWDWHDTADGNHYGEVFIRPEGGSWRSLGQIAKGNHGRKWSQHIIDLREYGGQVVQISFYFTRHVSAPGAAAGWYIDDVSLETGAMTFNNPEGFENGFGDWSIDNAMWEIGAPTYVNGPQPRSGKGVAGTILNGPYIAGDATLKSPEFLVPLAVERPRLRYWDWHDTADGNHYGEVFIRPAGGSWRSLGQIAKGNHGRKWSQHIIDLREYGGQVVQIGFYFTRHVSVPGAAAGWYIDDVSLETGAMTFNNPEEFENGFGDWSIDNAMWEIGAPTYGNGPQPRSGKGVAGTILNGPYIAGGATLKSPEFLVPLAVERPRLRYWDWHETADGNHYGEVFIRPEGGSWRSLGQIAKGNHGRKWSQHIIDLRGYGGQVVQIGFYFTRHVSVPGAAAGWYIDDVSLETGAMTFNNPEEFENGFGDWSIDNAMWEIGAPTYVNGPQPRSGKGVAGTILTGPYIAGDATLKSPEFVVPPARTNPSLRYWEWVDMAANSHYGQLYIRDQAGTWKAVGGNVGGSVREWRQKVVDLKPYSDQRVVIAFYFTRHVSVPGQAAGWYLDDVQIAAEVLGGVEEKAVAESTELAFVIGRPAGDVVLSMAPGAPAGAVIDSSTGTFRWTPSETQGPGVYSNLTVLAHHPDTGLNPMGRTQFVVRVAEVNSPPSLVVSSPPPAKEGQAFLLQLQATDPDLPANPLNYSVLSGPPGLRIDAATGLVTWSPSEAQGPASHPVSIMVTDSNLQAAADVTLTVTNSFTIVVEEVNTSPTFTGSLSLMTRDDVLFQTVLVAADADLPANRLVYSLGEGAPEGVVIDSATGLLTWPIGIRGRGETVAIPVRVTDDGVPPLAAEATLQVTITPEVLRLAPVADREMEEGALLALTVSLTNSPLAVPPLVFSVESGPSGLSINASSGALFWRPSETDGPSTNEIRLRVTDSAAPFQSATRAFKVVVREVNQPPSLTPMRFPILTPGGVLEIAAEATDPDVPQNRLTYSLGEGAPPGMTVHPVSGVIRWMPGPEVSGTTNRVTIVVSDDGSPMLTDSQTVPLIVGQEVRTVLSARVDSGGGLRIQIEGGLGRTYLVEHSADLRTWGMVTNFVSTEPVTEVVDQVRGTARFYRVLSP